MVEILCLEKIIRRRNYRLKFERSKGVRPWFTVLRFNNRCNTDIERGREAVRVTSRLTVERSTSVRPWITVLRLITDATVISRKENKKGKATYWLKVERSKKKKNTNGTRKLSESKEIQTVACHSDKLMERFSVVRSSSKKRGRVW